MPPRGGAETKGAEYNDILKNYPNHSDRDWDKMMVKAANRNKKLFDKDGEIRATKIQYRNTFLHDAGEVFCAILAFTLPIIILYVLS